MQNVSLSDYKIKLTFAFFFIVHYKRSAKVVGEGTSSEVVVLVFFFKTIKNFNTKCLEVKYQSYIRQKQENG